MYWKTKIWERLSSEDECQKVIAEINSKISSGDESKPFSLTQEINSSNETFLPVKEVSRCELPFFNSSSESKHQYCWYLYKLSFHLNNLAHLAVKSAQAFIVCGITQAIKAKSEKGEIALAIPLDWSSAVLHTINKIVFGSKPNFSNLTANEIREYLVYFSAFIADKEGPFLFSPNAGALDLDDAIEDFRCSAYKLAKEGMKVEGSPVVPGSFYRDRFDPFDILDEIASFQEDNAINEKKAESQQNLPPLSKDETKDLVANYFLKYMENPTLDNNRNFKGIMLYGNILYEVAGKISEDGTPHMTEDTPFHLLQDLELPRYWIYKWKYGINILCQDDIREEIDAEEFRKRLKQGKIIRRVRVKQSFRADKEEFPFLDGDDIQIMGDLSARDSNVNGSFELINCRILGSVNLSGIKVNGEMDFSRTNIFGGALKLEGGRIERNLSLDWVTVYGSIQVTGAVIKGGVSGRSLYILRPQYLKDPPNMVLDFENSEIAKELNLSSYVQKDPIRGHETPRRTRLEAHLKGKGLRVGSIILNGCKINGNIYFDFAKVNGPLEIRPYMINDSQDVSVWRTITDNIHLSYGNFESIFSYGVVVRGMFHAPHITIEKSMFWGSAEGGYRSIIHNSVTLSGCQIRGDLDFSGTQIQDKLLIVTGSIGRIKMGVLPIIFRLKGDRNYQAILSKGKVSQIRFSEIEAKNGLYLNGLEIVDGGFLGRNLKVPFGDLLFSSDDFYAWAEYYLEEFDHKLELSYEKRRAIIATWKEEVQSKISGIVSFPNLLVGGNINFGNAIVNNSENNQGVLIDLTGAEATLCKIDVKNIKRNLNKPEISLAHANIKNLNISGITNTECQPHFNIERISVGNWDIKPNSEVISLLKNSHPFDGNVFLDFEGRLNRLGYTKIGKEVYRLMAARKVEGGGRLEKLMYWLDWLFTGNGTQARWLIFIWILLVSLPLFLMATVPQNIEQTEKQQVVQWNAFRAMGLTLQYTLPFFPAAKDNSVKFKTSSPIYFPGWFPVCRIQFFAPHDLALVFGVGEYLLWLLFAANLPKIVRGN